MVKSLSLFCLLVLIAGCSSGPGRSPHLPPPGSVHEIRCDHRVQTCYYKARDRCLNSYKILNEIQTERTGGPYGRYKQYIVSIQCT